MYKDKDGKTVNRLNGIGVVEETHGFNKRDLSHTALKGDMVRVVDSDTATVRDDLKGAIGFVVDGETDCSMLSVRFGNGEYYRFAQENLVPMRKQSQSAKTDAGKLRLTLVPRKIIFEIAKIREYGCKKYKEPDNWKRVEVERYRDAAYRHFMAYLDEPNGVDKESGLPHLSHLACNIAFLCELEDLKE